jgi:8-oxo-dGTP pyrophosphatase MutT (NUDIX family)
VSVRLKALVWVLRPGPHGPEVLLLELTQRRGGGHHPVTGKADEGESAASCAEREAFEETGLRGDLHDLGFSHSFEDSRRGRRLDEHAFLLAVDAGSEPRISSEHVAARWVEPADARAALQWPAHRESLDRALQAWARR